MLVRRLIAPLVLHDESTRPDLVKADAEVKPGLLDGIVPNEVYNRLASLTDAGGDVYTRLASPICASWNQLYLGIRAVNCVRRAA